VVMAKVGANELWPCGSGRKYKKCRRGQDEKKRQMNTPTPEQLEGIMRVAREAQLDMEQAKYRAPEYQEFELGGKKFRIVGRGLYSQRHSGQLGDVIVEHLKTQVLGAKWLEEEGRKSRDKQHVVKRWLDAWYELRRKGQEAARASDTQTYSLITGEAQELLALADDVSRVLQLEKKLPKKLRTRLLNRNEFQGARYELAIAATFIRTNFRIEWIDDKTGPVNPLGKRCDFNAIHQVTAKPLRSRLRVDAARAVCMRPAQQKTKPNCRRTSTTCTKRPPNKTLETGPLRSSSTSTFRINRRGRASIRRGLRRSRIS
jgi:SEC-C motif